MYFDPAALKQLDHLRQVYKQQSAPKGQIIRLDFRNSFHIEYKEECKFDFLENTGFDAPNEFLTLLRTISLSPINKSSCNRIRDGQYGFSNLIGKYCGRTFPPEITSKERYLWLHFHSDESIEYQGFTAVYEFIDRNRDAPSTDLNCTIEKDGYEGFINSTDVPQEIRETVIRNKIPLDCMWRIQVQDKWKIQVTFLNFKLSKPNDCEVNFLDIFPEQTVMPMSSSISSTSTSTSCLEGEYDCEDATCIDGDLRCNGRSNCKFLWDEEGCKQNTGTDGQKEHMIIIITVFGLILGGMVITFLVNCIRKIMHDQKIIRFSHFIAYLG
uniref:CUB domain-containing protein n=1 Tax=Glossina austeni TaxID=7395 RepID=A0A1A9USY2_GLOAU